MRGVFASTNSTIRFLLLRPTVAVPSSPPFRLLPVLRRSQSRRRRPLIDSRAVLQSAASDPKMEPLSKSSSIEVKRDKQNAEPPVPQEAENPYSSLDLPPSPPEKPEPGDCCGSGCVPCIWDLYYDELEAYTKSLEAYNLRISSKQKKEHS